MNHLASFDLIILFFVLGVMASWVRSDLEIPGPVSKFLSIFLLLSLGLKGGHEVRIAENLSGFLPALTIGLASCLVIPFFFFYGLKRRFGLANAAALAASYGSVSAVTFVTAQSILENEAISRSGYMVAVMALMEIPAILIALILYQKYSRQTFTRSRDVFFSAVTAKSVVLLIGGFLIGLAMNTSSWTGIAPVVQGSFKGALAFFLIDLGIAAQRQLKEAWRFKLLAIPVALLAPLAAGTLALLLGWSFGLSQGDQILLAVLAGSASYIAAPAAIKSSMPEANPSLYLAMPLALTFPLNLLFGIGLYMEISRWLG